MRCWHKALIPYLPRQQLLGQWRECCLIAKNISEKGTPNHILVNRIMDYSLDHFWTYCGLICIEMESRGYRSDFSKLEYYMDEDGYDLIDFNELFYPWHGKEYLKQCYYNLEEKFDCGAIKENEFYNIKNYYKEVIHNGI